MPTIKNWPIQDRPRERLLQFGASALSDSELLAIFIHTGRPGVSAVELARMVLQQFGGFDALLKAECADFCKIKGLGAAKFVHLKAALEMVKRAMKPAVQQKSVIQRPEDLLGYFQCAFQGQPTERVLMAFLDTQNHLLGIETLSEGTIDHAYVYPRQVLERTLAYRAKSVILSHNHPTGAVIPSEADILLTENLRYLLNKLEVRLLDHLIIGVGQYYAFSTRSTHSF